MNYECPKCKRPTKIERQEISEDQRNNKEYNRDVYWCEQDDVWISIETPVET